MKSSIDERDRILNKTRQMMETKEGERLTQDEEEILKEIAGVLYTAYKRYIEKLDENETKRGEDEHEL